MSGHLPGGTDDDGTEWFDPHRSGTGRRRRGQTPDPDPRYPDPYLAARRAEASHQGGDPYRRDPYPQGDDPYRDPYLPGQDPWAVPAGGVGAAQPGAEWFDGVGSRTSPAPAAWGTVQGDPHGDVYGTGRAGAPAPFDTGAFDQVRDPQERHLPYGQDGSLTREQPAVPAMPHPDPEHRGRRRGRTGTTPGDPFDHSAPGPSGGGVPQNPTSPGDDDGYGVSPQYGADDPFVDPGPPADEVFPRTGSLPTTSIRAGSARTRALRTMRGGPVGDSFDDLRQEPDDDPFAAPRDDSPPDDPSPEAGLGPAAGHVSSDAVFGEVLMGDAAVDPRTARGQRGRKRRTKAQHFLILLVLLGLVSGATFGAWRLGEPTIRTLLAGGDYEGGGSGTVTIRIESGATGSDIAATLVAADVVKSVRAFVEAAKDDSRSSGIQPGTYELKKQMSAKAALALLLDDASRKVITVVVPEGYRLSQIYDLLAEKTDHTVSEFTKAAKDAEDWGLPEQADGKLEGFVFPSSYDFEPDMTAAEMLQLMVEQCIETLDGLGVAEADRYEVVTAASLIQAEGGTVDDYPKVSRVLHNRIKKGWKLQLDTTVHYALGTFKVATSDEQLKVKSPYNTYLHDGLPVGPIDNPGEEAMSAWLNPADGEWMYFVAVDPINKITKFGITDDDFKKIKAEYDAWAAKHPGY